MRSRESNVLRIHISKGKRDTKLETNDHNFKNQVEMYPIVEIIKHYISILQWNVLKNAF